MADDRIRWTADQWGSFALLAGGMVLIGISAVFAGWIIAHVDNVAVTLPMLVIGGVLILLVALSLISVQFAIMKLSNKDQPLGLPEGSVRAVIALSLVVLFAIVAIFLYANVAKGGKIEVAEFEFAADTDAFMKAAGTQILLVQPQLPPDPRAADEATRKDAKNKLGPFKVWYRAVNSPASDDLAKQLIVLLGTLVTAVASFYFGANSVASATAAATRAVQTTPPKPDKVVPASLKRGGGAQQLTITGTDLNQVTAVHLAKDGTRIDAAGITTSPTQVTCKVTVSASCELGKWDVVVSDGTTSAKLDKVVEIQEADSGATTSAADAAAPKPTGTDKAELKNDGTPQELKISGENLAGVTAVKLKKNGAVIENDGDLQTSDGEVVAKFTIASTRDAGQWDLSVSDGKTETKVRTIEIKA